MYIYAMYISSYKMFTIELTRLHNTRALAWTAELYYRYSCAHDRNVYLLFTTKEKLIRFHFTTHKEVYLQFWPLHFNLI